MQRTLDEWIGYIQTLHAREIELSLDRVQAVYERLYPMGPSFKVISIAGTNGKGSTSEIIASMYRSAGYQVGKFTSPHLIDFNERFSVNGKDAVNEELTSAFKKIEKARQDTAITFFEYGVLLALELFESASVDMAIMEVGLGGRLDAVNILDADVAVITSIAIDHSQWLGTTEEQIAYEKVGIARRDAPCIVGVRDTQQSIIKHCEKIGAELLRIGRDFDFTLSADGKTWHWQSGQLTVGGLPRPFRQAGIQLSNAAVALQAVESLLTVLPVSVAQMRSGLEQASLLARCQLLSQKPLIILDVAHNVSSVERLSAFVEHRVGAGKVIALTGMLQDKEVGESLNSISRLIDHWHLVTIDNDRGATAEYLQSELRRYCSDELESNISLHNEVVPAFVELREELAEDDCLVVFGSFYLAGDILRHEKNERDVPRRTVLTGLDLESSNVK